MMIDEIQTGFGRTGSWFGFQQHDVVPDVVTLAKAIGNGMPVGACWAKREVSAVFQPGDHGSTYSGTALATAAVSAVVDEMRRIDAPGLARKQGGRLTSLLEQIPQVTSVRGAGLLLGAQLAEGIDAPTVYKALLSRGLICNAVNASTLRFAPPLTVSDAELEEAAGLVADVLAEVGDVTKARSFLDVTDLTVDELRTVLELAERPVDSLGHPLAGHGVALIFDKPSNRTRQSMEIAVAQLGGHPVYTRGDEIGFDTRESVEDIARIMEGYHAILAARVFAHSIVERLAATASVPVVNMLSDWSHPLQALADALTMQQCLGDLSGKTVAYVGDYNNVARSLAEVAAMLDMHVRLGCPPGFDPDEAELERIDMLGAASVELAPRPDDAVRGAHAVHTDTWVSMGQENDKDDAPAGVRRLHGRQHDDGARRSVGGVHALPAGVPRFRGHGRRDRRPAERRLPTGPQPPARLAWPARIPGRCAVNLGTMSRHQAGEASKRSGDGERGGGAQ